MKNDKIAIEYTEITIQKGSKGIGSFIQIYDKQLTKLEKEFVISGFAIDLIPVQNDKALIVYENNIELWDFSVPKMIKSYKNILLNYGDLKNQDKVQNFLLYDSKTLFYPYFKDYLHFDLNKEKITKFSEYGFYDGIQNVTKTNTKKIVVVYNTYIDIINWNTKKREKTILFYPQYLFFVPLFIYPKRYIFAAVKEKESCRDFLFCWDEVTLKKKYLTKFYCRVDEIYELNQNEVLVVYKSRTSYCRVNLDNGQVTQIFKFCNKVFLAGAEFFNNTFFIIEENRVLLTKIPKLR